MEQKINFQKDKLKSNKEYVWHDKICTGYIEFDIRERQDIDWQKYRIDKSLRLRVKDRYIIKYTAYAFPSVFCGQFSSRLEAAEKIRNTHKEKFRKLKG